MTEKKPVPAPIDPHLVEKLGEIANRLDLSEIEVSQGELKIRVTRQGGAPAPVAAAPQPVSPPPVLPWPDAAAAHPGAVKSPMVGTVYLRPAPDTPPFVTIGSQVKPGDKILLIEAMKTFNEIVAPRAGTVTAILVEDAQPVEFDQPLVVIE
ncbi:MAG TPA: acetyl-CoA carboxylase biotin carboxyl carrier protein subunit [Gemmataceae bacterium]|nr:acetyl-CoA carboxylase biotin carboxyl carrier protein subunit [Gemmataceae bacterium]